MFRCLSQSFTNKKIQHCIVEKKFNLLWPRSQIQGTFLAQSLYLPLKLCLCGIYVNMTCIYLGIGQKNICYTREHKLMG